METCNEVLQGIYTKHSVYIPCNILDIAKTAGSQFKNSIMIWQGQLRKNQETYVCNPLLLAEDWLVAQDRQLVRQCSLN